jgi:hypothetical protein
MPCLRPNPLGGKPFWREFRVGAVGTYRKGMPAPALTWPCIQNSMPRGHGEFCNRLRCNVSINRKDGVR